MLSTVKPVALLLLIVANQFLPVLLAKDTEIKIALLTQDPPALNPLFPAFDPDSYSVISQIFDSLLYMDLDGNFQPGLATDWKKIKSDEWHFNLRRGVRFHNGEMFNANAVKFTFDYLLNPDNQAGNRWIFSSIKSVELVDNDLYQIRFKLHHPDGMFLHRFNMFGSICPPKYIKKNGVAHFNQYPIGTGPFQFKQWEKGKHINLVKNPNYWKKNTPQLDRLKFNIIPTEKWITAFTEGEVDFIPNLSGNDTQSMMALADEQVRIIKRPVLMSYWVLIKNEGHLQNIKLRKALNHAINKKDLIRYADFGNALSMPSLGKVGEFGANSQLSPYQYDPNLARKLLSDTEIALPIHLTALVADVAERPAKIIRKNLADIGVILDMEVVSRPEWSRRVILHKITTGQRAPYDIVINMVDNPIYHLAFHAGIFLDSKSPWSLLNDQELETKLAEALAEDDVERHRKKLEELDRYIQQQALMLFTTQKIITAAVRSNYSIDNFGANGHLDYDVLSQAYQLDRP